MTLWRDAMTPSVERAEQSSTCLSLAAEQAGRAIVREDSDEVGRGKIVECERRGLCLRKDRQEAERKGRKNPRDLGVSESVRDCRKESIGPWAGRSIGWCRSHPKYRIMTRLIAMENAIDPSTRASYASGMRSYIGFCRLHNIPERPSSNLP